MNFIERTLMRSERLVLLAVVALAGCTEVKIDNKIPVASIEIRVGDTEYRSGDLIPFLGEPVNITLDGSGSTDADGEIRKYLWFRTDVPRDVRFPDGGSFGGDPDEGETTEVSLPEGMFRVTLIVVDDDDEASEAVSVDLRIEEESIYMPVMACLDNYEGRNEDCEDCVCTPADMEGCYDIYEACFEHEDPTFSELCTALVDCANATGCIGAACYTPDLCAPEIDAASQYMGGDITACNNLMLATTDNPCTAASRLGNCVNGPDTSDFAKCLDACAP
jgi:hypothetical protein